MSVHYDEDMGIFTFQDNNILGFIRKMLGITDKTIHESELSVSKINELKEQTNKTTLTDQDTDALYKFSQFKGSKQEFLEIPLQNVFNLSKNDLIISKLMPLAYNKQPISEQFTVSYDYNYKSKGYIDKVIWVSYFILFMVFFYWILKI